MFAELSVGLGVCLVYVPQKVYPPERAPLCCPTPSSLPRDKRLAVPAGRYHGDCKAVALAVSVTSSLPSCLPPLRPAQGGPEDGQWLDERRMDEGQVLVCCRQTRWLCCPRGRLSVFSLRQGEEALSKVGQEGWLRTLCS